MKVKTNKIFFYLMMLLEKQVCSLELAKRLKELGVRQASLFHWLKFATGHDVVNYFDARMEPYSGL